MVVNTKLHVCQSRYAMKVKGQLSSCLRYWLENLVLLRADVDVQAKESRSIGNK